MSDDYDAPQPKKDKSFFEGEDPEFDVCEPQPVQKPVPAQHGDYTS